jgi:hypothetical protein
LALRFHRSLYCHFTNTRHIPRTLFRHGFGVWIGSGIWVRLFRHCSGLPLIVASTIYLPLADRFAHARLGRRFFRRWMSFLGVELAPLTCKILRAGSGLPHWLLPVRYLRRRLLFGGRHLRYMLRISIRYIQRAPTYNIL